MKRLLTIVISLAICFSLCGCYDSKEISRIAFIIAVGFDKDSYSFQVIKPSAFEGEGSEDSPLHTVTLSAPNVYVAMDMLNSRISEKCDYSHIKMVLFSQEKLEKGIGGEIESMLKSKDFHPNIHIAMCTGKARDYMDDMKIPLDANPAEYYENIFSTDFTEYSPDTTLKNLQPVCKNQDTANVLPVINSNSKMGILQNFRLVRVTDSHDALLYNLIENRNFDGNIPIKDFAVVRIKKQSVKKSLSFNNKVPQIILTLNVDGDLIWEEGETDISKLEDELGTKLQGEISNLLNACSREYKADILGFYRLAMPHYLTIQSWEKEDWQGLFQKAEYKVTVNAKIKREGLNKN